MTNSEDISKQITSLNKERIEIIANIPKIICHP